MISIDRPALFVAACDMPFLKYELIRCIRDTWMQMEKNSQKGTGDILRPLPVKGQDALIPCFDGRPQPLLGIYSKSIVEKLESSVRQGSRSLRHFLNELNVHYINEDVVRAIDPEGRSFVNINTLEDYQRERVAVGC
jgi:molybdopterin-guanine dinucleotide biosynthesis protein A